MYRRITAFLALMMVAISTISSATTMEWEVWDRVQGGHTIYIGEFCADEPIDYNDYCEVWGGENSQAFGIDEDTFCESWAGVHPVAFSCSVDEFATQPPAVQWLAHNSNLFDILRS